MATQPRIAFRPVRTLSGLAVPGEEFAEAASQTFVQGAVVWVEWGYLTECGTNPARIMGVASRAGQNGTAGTKKQLVFLAHPDTLFLGNLDNGSGTLATALGDRGRYYGVTKEGTSGKWYVNGTVAGSNARALIWEHWLQDNEVVGDYLGRVIFSFGVANSQGATTS